MKTTNNEQLIYLVRHGEKKFFMPDPVLTELGRAQAEQAGQKLKTLIGQEKALIISSPSKRTLETAELIGEILELSIRLDNDFKGDIVWPSKKSFLTKLADFKEIKSLIVVTHSQNIRQIVSDFFGIDGDIAECSISILKRTGEQLELVEAFKTA